MTISHGSALLDAAQLTFDATPITKNPAVLSGSQDVCVISSTVEPVVAVCVTVMVLVIPPPEMVIVPLLLAAPVFAVTFSVIAPLPDPLAGETVNHDVALLDAVHITFDVIDTDVLDKNADGSQEVRDTSRVDVVAAPACVTVMVLVIPPPEIVIIPVLLAVPVFVVTYSVRVPLPDPPDGETVNHDVALLDAVHVTFDVTVSVVLDTDAVGAQEVRDTSRLGVGPDAVPACVTVMVLVIPPPVNVIVPVLLVVPVFAAAVIASMAPPKPLVGDMVSHDGALLDVVHDTVDMTLTPVDSMPDNGVQYVGDTSSTAEGIESCPKILK